MAFVVVGFKHWLCEFLNLVLTFDSVQSAQRAKASLNGADIYSGCCTLKIEYAKVSDQPLLFFYFYFVMQSS